MLQHKWIDFWWSVQLGKHMGSVIITQHESGKCGTTTPRPSPGAGRLRALPRRAEASQWLEQDGGRMHALVQPAGPGDAGGPAAAGNRSRGDRGRCEDTRPLPGDNTCWTGRLGSSGSARWQPVLGHIEASGVPTVWDLSQAVRTSASLGCLGRCEESRASCRRPTRGSWRGSWGQTTAATTRLAGQPGGREGGGVVLGGRRTDC